MKILLVTSALGGGGAERVISLLARHFMLTNEVKVVGLVSDRCEYIQCDEIDFTFIGNGKNKIYKNIMRFLKLRRLIRNYKPDIIISFMAEINLFSIAARGRYRCPLIISERNDPYVIPKKQWVRKLRNFLYSKTDFIVFQTRDARTYFKNIPQNKTSILPNPIPDNLPEYSPERKEKFIFSAGRLVEQKNFSMLIRAFKILLEMGMNLKLIIAGEGPEEKKLSCLISDLNLKQYVELIGFTNNIYEYMSKCSIFALTSNYEGMSNVMLEAMAIGAPTICTDCPIGGAKMVIENNINGFLIPVNDDMALAETMFRLLKDPDLSMQISERAKEVKNIYSEDKICMKWEEIIKMLLT